MACLGGYAVLQGMICRQQQEVYGWQIRTPAAGSSRRSTGGTSETLQQVDFAGLSYETPCGSPPCRALSKSLTPKSCQVTPESCQVLSMMYRCTHSRPCLGSAEGQQQPPGKRVAEQGGRDGVR